MGQQEQEVENTENLELERQETESFDPPESGEHQEGGFVDGQEGEGVETGGEEQPYQPNFEYKILEETHVMPEKVQQYIKSEEDEKYFRDIFERAHGLDHVKKDRTELREENQQLRSTAEQYATFYNQLNNFRQQGDWDSYFEAQQVPPEVILKHANKLVNIMNDPNQQNQYVQQRQQFWGQQQQQTQSRELEDNLTQSRTREVDLILNYHPEVSNAAQQFDQRAGRPGAFKQEMVAYGQRVWHAEGRDASAEEAAQHLLKIMGYQPNNGQNAPQMAPSQGQQQFGNQMQARQPGMQMPQQQQPASQARPPVLPNMDGSGSGGGSAVRRPAIKSMDDLKRVREERRRGMR